MTSSCERKPSKEQGGKKDLFWEGGRRGRERRQRREAKKTGGMEKEGQRGSINRERPRDRRDRARKGLHFVPKHGRQGALPIPFCRAAGCTPGPMFAQFLTKPRFNLRSTSLLALRSPQEKENLCFILINSQPYFLK